MSLTLIKLGGSLITDKRVEATFRGDVMARIAFEIVDALRIEPDLSLIIGHGSGSFGHFAAKRHDTMNGVFSREQWHGFAEVAAAAADLNHLVLQVLRQAGLPAWKLQPSASLMMKQGIITNMALEPLRVAIQQGVIPLVYGDVSLDLEHGGTIASTETIFTYLVQQLPVKSVLLLGEVPGVLDSAGRVISEITPYTVESMREFLGGSSGTDVTGGMLTKVTDMVALVKANPELQVRIIDGTKPTLLRQALLGQGDFGTLIHGGSSELPENSPSASNT